MYVQENYHTCKIGVKLSFGSDVTLLVSILVIFKSMIDLLIISFPKFQYCFNDIKKRIRCKLLR